MGVRNIEIWAKRFNEIEMICLLHLYSWLVWSSVTPSSATRPTTSGRPRLRKCEMQNRILGIVCPSSARWQHGGNWCNKTAPRQPGGVNQYNSIFHQLHQLIVVNFFYSFFTYIYFFFDILRRDVNFISQVKMMKQMWNESFVKGNQEQHFLLLLLQFTRSITKI